MMPGYPCGCIAVGSTHICGLCSGGTIPNQVQINLNNAPNYYCNCTNLAGTYLLDYTTNCTWQYNWTVDDLTGAPTTNIVCSTAVAYTLKAELKQLTISSYGWEVSLSNPNQLQQWRVSLGSSTTLGCTTITSASNYIGALLQNCRLSLIGAITLTPTT
jgi:hypothetical protein